MIRKFFASIIVFLILIVAPIFSLFYALLDSYLSPDFYTDEKVIEEVHDALTTYLGVAMEEGIRQQTGEDLVDGEEITEQVGNLVSSETLLETSEDIMSQLTQVPLPDMIEIDVTTIKENLPEVMTTLLEGYVDNLQDCTEEEEAALLESGGEDFPTCIPSLFDKEAIMGQLDAVDLSSYTDSIPDRTALDLSVIPQEARTVIEVIIQQNTLLKAGMLATYLILVALVALIIWKPLKSVLKWTGNAFFWSAIPLAVTHLMIKSSGELSIPNIAENAGIDPEILQESLASMMAFIGFVTEKMMWHGIIFSSIGAVLFIAGIIVKAPKEESK